MKLADLERRYENELPSVTDWSVRTLIFALSFCCFWKLGNLPLANLVLSNAFFAYSWRTSVLRNILRDRGEDKAYVTHADRFAVLNLILGGLFVLLALLLFALPAASVPAGNS